MNSLANHIFAEIYNTYKERRHTTFPIRSNHEFQMKIGEKNRLSVYFHAWIDKRFDERGEICLLISHSIPPIPEHFNGVIYLSEKEIMINNYGFFRGQEATSICQLNEDSLLNMLCSELQSWSEPMYA